MAKDAQNPVVDEGLEEALKNERRRVDVDTNNFPVRELVRMLRDTLVTPLESRPTRIVEKRVGGRSSLDSDSGLRSGPASVPEPGCYGLGCGSLQPLFRPLSSNVYRQRSTSNFGAVA